MSQASDLNIYFVLPEEDKEAECSENMVKAFNCVKQYKGNPNWVLPSFCLCRVPTPSDVFVFERFSGPAFERLKTVSAKILGARCMLTCMTAGDTIPPGDSPIFTEGMRDLIVCCSGFDPLTKKLLEEKISYMGGIYDTALRTITTHVVAENNITCKATQAYIAGIPVMKKEWVEAVWDRSLVANVRGHDKEFATYEAPLFNNLEITTSGIPKKQKEKLKDLITHHGGSFTGELRDQKTNILLISNPTGQKYKAAKEWRIKCLKPEWVYKCVETKKVVPLKEYSLDEPAHKASTPKKGEMNLTANFSMVSAIGNEERHMTHIEESTMMHIPSQGILTPQSQRKNNMATINEIMLKTKDSAQFLDGCNIFLSGFSQNEFEKLKKIVNLGGATRFDDLSRSVTHIVYANVVGNNFRETGAYVLPLEWLKESVDLKRPAPVDKYVSVEVNVAKTTPPSPLSKQSAMLLNRNDSKVAPLEFDFPAEEFVQPDDDLMRRYNLSQQSEKSLPQVPVRIASNCSKTPVSRSESTLNNDLIFQNLKFFLSSDISEEEVICAEKLITDCGGTMISRRFSGVPDFAVVPIIGAVLTEITAKEVVNLFYIKDCCQNNQVMDIQYYHMPVTWRRGTTPLADCVVSISKYVGSSRDFIETIIATLGGTIQAILARKQKGNILKTTHLLCPEPAGEKYLGALRWGLPVVHHDWLLKCAELGVKVPEKSYLVGEASTVSSSPSVVLGKTSTTSLFISKSNENVLAAGSNMLTPITARESPASSFNNNPDKGLALRTEEKESLDISQKVATNLQRLEPSAPSPVNKALERLKHMGTPQGGCSPESEGNRTMTPTSPYGAFYGNDNPSPATRKRLYKWMNQGADFPLDPPMRKIEQRRSSTPLSEMLSKQLKLMMRPREDESADECSFVSPAKRPHLSLNEKEVPETTDNELMSGLLKMKEIEDSYSKSNAKNQSPARTCTEPKMLFVAESQPHTEIGWDDPTEHGGSVVTEPVQVRKLFMLSGLSEHFEEYKVLIEDSGGIVSSLACFDKNATHLIAATSMTRAEKLMGSIAAGLWILHPSYLERLKVDRSVHKLKEEEFEWGCPALIKERQGLSKVVRECVENAYNWRRDVQIYKKPLPFQGMKFILNLSASKSESFSRLIEAGGGEIVTPQSAMGNNVFAVHDPSNNQPLNFDSYARRRIKCVTSLFINDIIQRIPTALENNYVSGFLEIWSMHNS